MKTFKFFLGIGLFFCFYLFACKKNPVDNNTNNNQPANGSQAAQAIKNDLSKNDSLQQFNQLFKSLSLSDADVAGGITVLAANNNALINPVDIGDLKDYIIKGVVAPADFTNGKVFTSITGKAITITVVNGIIYANGVMISALPVASAAGYNVYASAGLYISGSAAYDDPHKSEYYLEYYDNGVYHSLSGSYITSWPFFNNNNFPTPVTGNCSYPYYTSYASGPSQALVAFAADNPFALQINRTNFTTIPVAGDYKISTVTYDASQNKNTGNCNLVINGAVFGCDLGDKDSYVHVNITEVKVDQDLGLEKRGYYKGEFDAILYYKPHNGGAVEKRVITGGRFMAPMGGNQTTPINGTAPANDRYTILTTGKWYLRTTVELYLNNPNFDFAPCNLDDYFIFRTNGTLGLIDGGIKCGNHEGDVDYADNIPWVFKNNQTVITIGSGSDAEDWTITDFSDSSMIFGEFKLSHTSATNAEPTENQQIIIDGIASYSGKGISFGINSDEPTSTNFIVTGANINPSDPGIGFVFYLTPSMKVGDVISLKAIASHTNLQGWARYKEGLGAQTDYSTENSSYSGSLTTTKFDSKSRILSGTFQFKGAARDQYGKYLGEKSVSGSLQDIYCVDATNGKWPD